LRLPGENGGQQDRCRDHEIYSGPSGCNGAVDKFAWKGVDSKEEVIRIAARAT
jgi:hypothetical protein